MSAETNQITDISTGANPTERKSTQRRPEPAVRKPIQRGPEMIQDTQPGWPSLDVAKFFEDARERLREAFEQANGRFDHVRHAARDTSDVIQECQSATISGLKEIGEHAFDQVQADLDRLFDLGRSMTEVKSLPDLLRIQGEFVREAFEHNLTRFKTLNELSTNLIKATYEPFQAGMANVISQARKRAG